MPSRSPKTGLCRDCANFWEGAPGLEDKPDQGLCVAESPRIDPRVMAGMITAPSGTIGLDAAWPIVSQNWGCAAWAAPKQHKAEGSK
jgi:hypothetical protein